MKSTHRGRYFSTRSAIVKIGWTQTPEDVDADVRRFGRGIIPAAAIGRPFGDHLHLLRCRPPWWPLRFDQVRFAGASGRGRPKMVKMALQYVRRELSDPRRQRLYREAILIAVAGNVLLAATKGAVAWFSGSSAVLSERPADGPCRQLALGHAVQPDDGGWALPGTAAGRRIPSTGTHPLRATGESADRRCDGSGWTQTAEDRVSQRCARGRCALFRARRRCGRRRPKIVPGWPTAVLAGSVVVKVAMFLWVGRIGRLAYSPAIDAVDADVRRWRPRQPG
jgi:hypothetical protein